jgi:hypothetical protein
MPRRKSQSGLQHSGRAARKNILCCPYNHTFHLMKAMKIMLREEKQTAEQAC